VPRGGGDPDAIGGDVLEGGSLAGGSFSGGCTGAVVSTGGSVGVVEATVVDRLGEQLPTGGPSSKQVLACSRGNGSYVVKAAAFWESTNPFMLFSLGGLRLR